MLNIQQLINDAVKPEPRAAPVHWRASRLGQCLRGVYLERLGKPPDKPFDERTLRVFSCGKMFEGWIIDKITRTLPKEDWDSQTVVSLPDLDAEGHPDLVLKKEKVIYELKTVHSRKFWHMTKAGGEPDEHYLKQLMFYLLASGYEEGRLLYVSKDDLAIVEYVVRVDNEKLKNSVLDELKILNEALKTGVAPEPEPAIVNGKINWKARYCSWHNQCLGNPNWLVEASKETKEKVYG